MSVDLNELRRVAEIMRTAPPKWNLTEKSMFVHTFTPETCLALLDRIAELEQVTEAHRDTYQAGIDMFNAERTRAEAWKRAALAYAHWDKIHAEPGAWSKAQSLIAAARALDPAEPEEE